MKRSHPRCTGRYRTTPARTALVDIPPKVASIKVKEIAAQESVNETQLPPVTKSVASTRFEGDPQVVFRKALCDHEVTPDLVRRTWQPVGLERLKRKSCRPRTAMTIFWAIARTMAQKSGEIWTGPRLLQPVRLKSDRLLGIVVQCRLQPRPSIWRFGRYNHQGLAGRPTQQGAGPRRPHP